MGNFVWKLDLSMDFFPISICFVPWPKETVIPNFIEICCHLLPGLCFQEYMDTQTAVSDKLTCMCATHIVPEGEGVKADLERCITKKKMKVLGFGNVCGVDLEYWRRKSGERKEEEVLTFVFVGRIVGDKGVNELVSAFVRLNATPESPILTT